MYDAEKKKEDLKKRKEPTKRQLQAMASKKKIFDTAQALFAAHGYENVTVADICREADVSVGLFYNYFKSKSDISAEALQLIEKEYITCAEHFTPEDTADVRLLKIARLMLADVIGNEYMLQNARIQYTREARGIPPFVFSHDRPLSNILHDIAKYGQETGQFRRDISPKFIIRVVFRYIIGSTVYLLNAANKEAAIEKSLADLKALLSAVMA